MQSFLSCGVDMNLNHLLALIGPSDLVAAGALIVSAYAAIGNRRAVTIDGFNALCEQLQKRLATVEEELEKLRGENSALKARVKELEDERDRLKVQIEELQRKRARGKGRAEGGELGTQ